METSSKALRLLLLAALLPISLLGGCRARQRTVQSSYAERDSLHTELRAQTQTASEAAYEENGVVLLLGAADADPITADNRRRYAALPTASCGNNGTPPERCIPSKRTAQCGTTPLPRLSLATNRARGARRLPCSSACSSQRLPPSSSSI